MRSVQIRQTILLIVLTLVYLTFELGFNARLLDVVGGGSTDDVHNIENYGRTLSGIAAALVVFQLMLRRRARNEGQPGWKKIAFWCGFTVVAVFIGIKVLVDGLVFTRDAEFGRMAMNTTLLQRALLDGRVTLTGLSDDPAVFSKPEGKAFLALFPFMAVSVNNLEERIRSEKEMLVRQSVAKQIGAQNYLKSYQEAIAQTHKKWLQYARIPTSSDQGLRQEQDKAWNEYRNSLARHRWTPQSVPENQRGKVVSNVRRKVPVPPNWDPSDEATFRDAVEQKYRSKMASTARSVTVQGDVIPPGLSFAAFVARPGLQRELRNVLKLPASATVAASYASQADFLRLFDQAVALEAGKRLERFSAAARELAPGGRYHRDAEDATRAAIVPPVALFFSLLGAIGHFSKLLYLIATLVLLLGSTSEVLSRRRASIATGVLLCALGSVWVSLSMTDNSITRSELFGRMIGWMKYGAGAGAGAGQSQAGVGSLLLSNVIHVVAVGQGYGYPLNEAIRVDVLQGLKYGYEPTK